MIPDESGTPLRTLLAAYLNQDWPEEYPDVWDAVADFTNSASAEFVAAAHAELEEILERTLSEPALEALLASYYCDYYPPGDAYTYDGWLRELEVRLRNKD